MFVRLRDAQDCARTALCPSANCIDTLRNATGMTHSLKASTQSLALNQATRDERQTSEDYNVSPTTHTNTSVCNAAKLWCPSINLSHCGSRCNRIHLRVSVLLIQIALLRYKHVPRVSLPSQVSLLPIRYSRWTLGRGKVRIVQHVISIIHCALQQSIERDNERTVIIMNLFVSEMEFHHSFLDCSLVLHVRGDKPRH